MRNCARSFFAFSPLFSNSLPRWELFQTLNVSEEKIFSNVTSLSTAQYGEIWVGTNNAIVFYSIFEGKFVHRRTHTFRTAIVNIAKSKDVLSLVATSLSDGTIQIWQNEKKFDEIELPYKRNPLPGQWNPGIGDSTFTKNDYFHNRVNAMAFCGTEAFKPIPDIFLGCGDNTLRIYSYNFYARKWHNDQTLEHGLSRDSVNAVKVINNKNFVSASSDLTIKFWQLNQDNKWRNTYTLRCELSSGGFTEIDITDSARIVAANFDSIGAKSSGIIIWKKDGGTWKVTQIINGLGPFKFFECGKTILLIVASKNRQIEIHKFNNHSRFELIQSLAHTGNKEVSFISVIFAGKKLKFFVTSSCDGTMNIWKENSSCQL